MVSGNFAKSIHDAELGEFMRSDAKQNTLVNGGSIPKIPRRRAVDVGRLSRKGYGNESILARIAGSL